METSPDELDLNESYRFRVIVENNGTRFAGELCLSPDECSLIVRGDESEGRSQSFDWRAVDEMTCNGFDRAFSLHGLRGRGARNQTIQRLPTQVSHFEVRYDVSHVIFGRGRGYRQPTFTGIDFHSPSIARWVGYTHMQETIVTKYHDGTLFRRPGESYTEFVQFVPGLGVIAIAYYPSSRYSVDEFSMGLQFAPVLSLIFDAPKTEREVIGIVNEIDILFSFLLGASLELEKIHLITSDGRIHPSSMYFSRAIDKVNSQKYPLFPLGMNRRLDDMGLPQFPVESFSKYFSLAKAERVRFGKYIKYRHLENPEERFLGFFRLLEKLCFQKESFLPEEKLIALIGQSKPFLVQYFGDKKNVGRVLERLVGWNNSKMNTAGCIARFMKKIPKNLRQRWVYGANDINDICELRNDLTHANEVEPETYEVERKAKFIEVLLVIRLLIAIDVSAESAASIATRLQKHVLIEKREDAPVAVANA